MTENDETYFDPEHSTEEYISPPPIEGSSNDPLIGMQIGSCTIKRIIGSGGMGIVYEAIQENPRRRVALKMMKRGITSRSATRRFEFESQTLARLKHPGVAQVYEAGTHDDGKGSVPYFVMEYVVNAKPITTFANDKKLTTKERLILFSKVCGAIQHGHLKGIVHRDLKPGNILVDSSGRPKVIDFGVARSTDSDLAVTTLQTDVGQLIGTLQYMSPEQCEADPSDIDIRSDVYALGVILFELLTGNAPYDLKRMAIHEAIQIVREQEPLKLSTLNKHLRGDIETITFKALEKGRERRYQSATAMQEDILHYLNDEPITARPPGALDYIRRFAKKHVAATTAIASIFVVLVAAVIVTSNYAVKIESQRSQLALELDKTTAVKDFVSTMFSSNDSQHISNTAEMDQQLMMHLLAKGSKSIGANFENQPLVEAEIQKTIGRTYLKLHKYAEAKPHLEKALRLYDMHSDLVRLNERSSGVSFGSLSTKVILGRLHFLLGDFQKSKELLTDAVALSKSALGENHIVTLNANIHMADLLNREGKYNESEKYINLVLHSQRKTLGNSHVDTIETLGKLGVVYFGQGKYAEAAPCFREVLKVQLKINGENHSSTINTMLNLGNTLMSQEKYEEAKPLLVDSLKIHRQILGNNHPNTAKALNSLGTLFKKQGNFSEAEPYYREGIEISKRVSGDSHPKTLWLMGSLGNALADQGKFEEAVSIIAESLTKSRIAYGDDNPTTIFLIGNIGELFLKQEKYNEAEMALLELIEIYSQTLSADHPNNYWAYDTLRQVYEGWGKPEKAKKYFDLLPKE
jgi:serine/threonine protein kinase